MQNSQWLMDEHSLYNSGISDNKFALAPEFYLELLQLEQQINSGIYNLDIVNKAISHYAKCVEYFDSVNDSVKIYFMEKIQATLANQKTLMKLLNCDSDGKEVADQDNKFGNKNLIGSRDSFLSQDEQMGHYFMNPDQHGFEEGGFDSGFNDNAKSKMDHINKKGMRQGLLKMQEDMKRRRQDLLESKDPEDIKKQQIIRQRQMQILMEAQRGYMEVTKGNNNEEDQGQSNQQEQKQKNFKEIMNDQETFEKETEELVEKDMQDQADSIQRRLQERKLKMLEKKLRQSGGQSEEKIVIQKSDISIFTTNEEVEKVRKISVNLQDENNNSVIENQYAEDNIQNNSGVHQNISTILDNSQEIENKNNQQQQMQKQVDEDEEIEEQIQEFVSYTQKNKLPEALQKSLKKVSVVHELDEKTQQEVQKYIEDFERKQKMSKSMSNYEIQEELLNNIPELPEKNEVFSANQMADVKLKQSLMSSSPYVKNKKKNGRNLSVQFVDTRTFNVNSINPTNLLANNPNQNVQAFNKIDIIQPKSDQALE